jgi:hypothetical protein
MKDLTLLERLERLDDWARHRNLLKPNETLFAEQHSQISSRNPSDRLAAQSDAHIVGCRPVAVSSFTFFDRWAGFVAAVSD